MLLQSLSSASQARYLPDPDPKPHTQSPSPQTRLGLSGQHRVSVRSEKRLVLQGGLLLLSTAPHVLGTPRHLNGACQGNLTLSQGNLTLSQAAAGDQAHQQGARNSYALPGVQVNDNSVELLVEYAGTALKSPPAAPKVLTQTCRSCQTSKELRSRILCAARR